MEEYTKYPSKVFSIAELHQTYWKEFCDAYYYSFGIGTNEDSSYEQKYDTFCRLKEWSENGKGYKEEHLEVYSLDFRFLKTLEERLYSLKDKEELIPSLYYYVRTIRSIRRRISIKNWTIKNIRPDIIDKYIGDYSDYLLDETKVFQPQDEEYWPNIRDVVSNPTYKAMSLETDILDSGYTIEYNPADGCIISLADIILEDEIPKFNRELRELMNLLPVSSNCPVGEEQKLFLYRLFMTYKDSLAEIKKKLEELPCPLNLSRLQEEHDHLIHFFKISTLGSQWIQCMEHKDGIKYMAKYFMNHRYNCEFEGNQFFLMLDKIGITEDILNGNAHKYGLEIEYPKEWFATEEKDRKNSVKEEDVPSFALSNIIFNPKIFTNEQQYAQLRKIILSFIEQKKENVEKEEFQIKPQIQAEWYFIKRAILEAEVTNRDNLTNPKFLRQMRAWFPACFKIGKDEKEEKKIIKQYGESISRERKKWVNGTEKKEVPIEHMIEHGKSRKYVKANTLSRYNVLKKLKKKLKDFKDNNN